MTNKVKQSLEENMDSILKNLPEEYHANFKASVAEAAPAGVLTAEEAKQEAISCIRENPTITNEDEAIALVNNDFQIGQAIQQPSDAELDIQKETALAEVTAALDS